MLSIREILDKLYEVKSPSGFEGKMAKVITEIAKSEGLESYTDTMGNIIVHRAGIGKKCLIDAHMDTIGFLATYIDEKGFVRFDALGGFDMPDLHNIQVEFLNGTRGVISYEQKTALKDRKLSSMFIDIGAKNVIDKLLPIVDNFERGFSTVAEEDKEDAFVAGMEMVYKQLMTMFETIGVKAIEAVGKEFNPDLHNAVMHVEDETVGENIVVEEFQKGYTYHDIVVRYSMVKVAN